MPTIEKEGNVPFENTLNTESPSGQIDPASISSISRLEKLTNFDLGRPFKEELPDPLFLTYRGGDIFEGLLSLSKKNLRPHEDLISENPITRNIGGIYKNKTVTIGLVLPSKKPWEPSVGALSMFRAILSIIAENNPYKEKIADSNSTAFLSAEDFAKRLGEDILPHLSENMTKEEKAAERKKARIRRGNFFKKMLSIKDELSFVFYSASARGVPDNFFPLFDPILMDDRHNVIATLSDSFRAFLDTDLVVFRPVASYRIDDLHKNAQRLAEALSNYGYNYKNTINGRGDVLKVLTLLGYIDLPSIEEIRKKDPGHWRERLKIPFENMLDYLCNIGVLDCVDGWFYCNQGGERMSDSQAATLDDSFEAWISSRIRFKLKSPPPPDKIERYKKKVTASSTQNKKKYKRQEKR